MAEDPANRVTDWDNYYTAVPFTARFTRRYTTAVLIRALKGVPARGDGRGLNILEIGGANSCFLDPVLASVDPASYEIVDTNQYGLGLLQGRAATNHSIKLRNESVLDLRLDTQADVVFSVGLIEHFNESDTRLAIRAHLRVLRPGGTLILTFPTPTLLYRACRRVLEMFGFWKFPDERPLLFREVVSTVEEQATILERRILWPLFLTQGMIVARKLVNADGSAS